MALFASIATAFSVWMHRSGASFPSA